MSSESCRNHPDATGPIVPCARCGATFCNDCIVYLQGRPYCATCKNEHLRDVSSGVDATQLPLASIGRRFAAIFLDQLIITVPVFLVVLPLTFLIENNDEMPCAFFAVFGVIMVIALLYEPLMISRYGATL